MSNCCNDLCTHRQLSDTPVIQWSKNAASAACSTSATVLDQIVDASGSLYVCGHWYRPASGYYGFVQKWSAAGSLTWSQDFEVAMHCLSHDGTSLFAGGDSRNLNYANAFKLVPSTGATTWSVLTRHRVIFDCIHDGAGGLYVCGTLTGAADFPNGVFYTDCGYASLLTSAGALTDSFGGAYFNSLGVMFETASTAYSIDRDSSGNVYIGSTVWRANTGNCTSLDCGPTGSVAKFNSSRVLVWLLGDDTCAAVRYYDGNVYAGFNVEHDCQLEKWNATTAVWVWGRTLKVDQSTSGFGYPISIRPGGVTDIDVSANGVYTTHQHWLTKHSHAGTYDWSHRHQMSTWSEGGKVYWTVEIDPADADVIYVGGRAAECTASDENTTTSSSCSCSPTDTCDCVANTVSPFGQIFSYICPCEDIPCSVPDTFYGSGCFDGIEVDFTWTATYFPDSAFTGWTAQFTFPCGTGEYTVNLTAAQVSATECTGWEVGVTATLTTVGDATNCGTESGAATVTACPCTADSDYGHPWFDWEASFDFGSCSCCSGGTGGGGNQPPETGSSSACCSSGLVSDNLLVTFTGCITGTGNLTKSGSVWSGTSTSTCAFDMAFSCVVLTPEWRLLLTGVAPDGGCTPVSLFSAMSACDPLVIVFTGVAPIGTCSCCGGGSTFTVTITEA